MDPIPCFWLEPVPLARKSLRRYAEGPCNHRLGYHNAEVTIGDCPMPLDECGLIADNHPHEDPRWPPSCQCGYVFTPGDHWLHSTLRLYKRTDTGELTRLHTATVGAMWNADWLGENFQGPDGLCLVVKTPGGDWTIDGASKDGGKWTRTGTPPRITARPSILLPNYHGWLTDGLLTAC